MKNPKIQIRPVGPGDIGQVAEMNLNLIRDEGSVNPMSLAQLEDRMRAWLAGAYKALLVLCGDEVIGYALYRSEPEEHSKDRPRIYLRQYFIKKQFRKKGYGKAAIDLILAQHFPENSEISVDVLETNPGGKEFWEKAGFKKYFTNFRRS